MGAIEAADKSNNAALRLAALGVTPEMVPDLVPHALADLAHFGAPVKPTAEQYAALYLESM